ncbi:class I SAM-dependent methyltransferase [Dictyoglomus thermophilum]|uniref:Methyltransferase, putative n=2 Tax=Dictyoglomus thermophilum TaxID=14 RepID=B5YBL0_DICT6|nr:class I SAM-dependent methyltransferase [Dictyoglomus thermophilum]ACI19161.1 methyltransferase, putative [Dictyoglomus thermophilum H-6-12]TYT20932.1 class I SAM-dependent methyltransferase [Dictyoglomus thermophilum]
MKHQGWDWKEIKEERWDTPAEEVYYLLNRWKDQGKSRFLDLGCGRGRHSIFFAKHGFEVYATDISESGIEILKEKAKLQNLNINAEVCDMHNLPYSNEFFDCMLAFHVIYHTNREGIRRVISEIYRVLKKDGECFLTFNSKFSKSFNNPNNILLEDGTVIKKEGIEAGIPHYYVDKEEVLELMNNFEIISFKYVEEILPKRSNKFFVLATKK